MIDGDNAFGTVTISCDYDKCKQEQEFETGDYANFLEACKEAKSYGWTIKKESGDWVHYCPKHQVNP